MYHIISNPASGKRKEKRNLETVKRVFDERGAKYLVYETTRPGEATEIAAKLTAQANDELCAMAQKESTQILNKVLRSASEQMKNGFSFADTCVNK